jgi:hypothetical protein
MKNEFVPYEIALALKELGFDKPCIAKYTVIPEDNIDWFIIPEQGITNKTSFGSSKNYNSKSFEVEGTISAPTYSQAFRFFREKYDCHHTIQRNKKYVGIAYSSVVNYSIDEFDSHEEAELECLKKLIEIVKEKQL